MEKGASFRVEHKTRSPVVKLSSPTTKDYWEIDILYEDDYLLALNKPGGLLTSPDRYDPERPNLLKLLHRGISQGSPWAREHKLDYLMNAHRLDFETSGVLLLAKQKPILVSLANLFSSEKANISYVALVHGSPIKDTISVDAKIGSHPTRVGIVRVDEKRGKRSRTEFRVLKRFRRHALLECHPLTSRTHQVRIHLKHAKFPIVGDSQYAGKPLLLSSLKSDYRLKPGAEERPLISTTALHAEKLLLPHPITDSPLEIKAPWPKDLVVAIKYLQRYGA